MSEQLRKALARDDALEDQGMHADSRQTCHQCQSWADHAHHPRNNAVITWAEYEQYKKARGL
ncbi:hypothetical protein K1T35_48185 (plasmid) [Pseudonocardia sp. DSM 110487]|uniref:hypothetical protein n=1 Tax=Pseudonocardia sp. DSM 110487 TaxID=2865833 RepID=UPI001C699072|nr:hypothetical protein [Pseudonocardia sp. DSM 110487]QYN41129.1 hypothetical protein K1T35_48185 [Pseudonocardia sp. DSM 110487]